MVITVHLHTIYQLQTPSGPVNQLEKSLPAGSQMADLVKSLGIIIKTDETLFILNGRTVDLDQVLEEGDQVHLIPAISGGSDINRWDIEEGLRKLGLCAGDAVEVHSSLSSFGAVEGGAASVISSIMNVVGLQGAIVMSAYPVSLPIPLSKEDIAVGITWKVRKLNEESGEKTGMGTIADEFRRRPDVLCGSGLHRVCAWGRDAHLHCRGYSYLLDTDGWVLLLGVGIDRCSSMHQAEKEDLPDKIKKCVAVPELVRRIYPRETWEVGYGGTPEDGWMKVWEGADRRGLINKYQIGNARCALFRARDMVGIYEGYLREDPFWLFGVSNDG